MSLLKYFFETKPVKEVTVEGTVLPNFPNFHRVSKETIWDLLNNSSKVKKLTKEGKPSERIGIDFTVSYDIDNRFDSEDWPTHSPIKVYVKIIEKEEA